MKPSPWPCPPGALGLRSKILFYVAPEQLTSSGLVRDTLFDPKGYGEVLLLGFKHYPHHLILK